MAKVYPQEQDDDTGYVISNMMSESDILDTNNAEGCVLPGLHFMIGLNYMRIKQVIDILEVFIGLDFANYYDVFDSRGFRLFVIGERTDCCVRICCTTTRPFIFEVLTPVGEPIEVTVSHTLSGKVLGRISQQFFSCRPTFNVYNGKGEFAAKITGPLGGAVFPECVCWTASFNIFSADGGPSVGCVKKRMGTLLTECCTVADTYEVTFDPKANVELKATLMGVAIAVDFTYFESYNWGKGPFWMIFSLLIVVAIVLLIIYHPFPDQYDASTT